MEGLEGEEASQSQQWSRERVEEATNSMGKKTPFYMGGGALAVWRKGLHFRTRPDLPARGRTTSAGSAPHTKNVAIFTSGLRI